MFSPYYAWAGRADPLNHCAVNVALYGRGHRWAMTERRSAAVSSARDNLIIGPSALHWDGRGLTISLDEIAVPLPKRVRGTIRVEPSGINTRAFTLDANGKHIWRPIAPAARVEVDMSAPGLRWSGDGYFDMNAGDEPLENGFSSWTWSRASLRDGGAVLYDAERRDGSALSLGLRFTHDGSCEAFAPPRKIALPKTAWRVERETRSKDGARVLRTFEDTPFYARSLIETTLFGATTHSVHESLSLNRFRNPVVRAMLPFRMPRR